MRQAPTFMRRWRVGELAAAAGVTVRALHHYEQVGLLAATARTSAEHRLYDAADDERLYRIRMLRDLGMPLHDIRHAINGDAALSDLLRSHLVHVEAEVERLTRLRDRLRSLTAADEQITPDDVLATLEAMSRVERHAHARRRTRAPGDQEMERRWLEIGDQLRACLDAGDPPTTQRAMAARRRRVH